MGIQNHVKLLEAAMSQHSPIFAEDCDVEILQIHLQPNQVYLLLKDVNLLALLIWV